MRIARFVSGNYRTTMQMTMRLFILTFFLTTFSRTLFGQSNDTWIAFWNKDTTLIGYKDKNGLIKIEPKFTGFSTIFVGTNFSSKQTTPYSSGFETLYPNANAPLPLYTF